MLNLTQYQHSQPTTKSWFELQLSFRTSKSVKCYVYVLEEIVFWKEAWHNLLRGMSGNKLQTDGETPSLNDWFAYWSRTAVSQWLIMNGPLSLTDSHAGQERLSLNDWFRDCLRTVPSSGMIHRLFTNGRLSMTVSETDYKRSPLMEWFTGWSWTAVSQWLIHILITNGCLSMNDSQDDRKRPSLNDWFADWSQKAVSQWLIYYN
jgi:hypothetical protein